MLRQFPPENASKKEFVIYQLDSDEILKSLSSSSLPPLPLKIEKQPYDQSSLNNLSNLANEVNNAISDSKKNEEIASAARIIPKSIQDSINNKAGLQKQINSGDMSDDAFILSLIFKIVPIGVNIAKKGKTIAQGLKETANGIIDTIKNAALLTFASGTDTIYYVKELFIYLYKLILCSVSILSNFPVCVIFYLFDLIALFILILIFAILLPIDMCSGGRTGLIKGFLQFIQTLEAFDKMIYSYTSLHIIHYPDSIINKCYRCSAMGDTSGYKEASGRLFNDLFVRMPNEVGGPVSEFFTGIGHIFSFFDI
jgi:hypothetical protein